MEQMLYTFSTVIVPRSSARWQESLKKSQAFPSTLIGSRNLRLKHFQMLKTGKVKHMQLVMEYGS
jgi:hypothetical protein